MNLVRRSTAETVQGLGRGRSRDRELVRFVGRHGLVQIGHVMEAMGAGRTVTYDRVACCVEAGLLERIDLLRSEPGLLRATRAGLRYAGLGLPVAVISPGAVDHWLRCTSTALRVGKHFGDDLVLTERELVLAESIEGRPIASAVIGEHPGGSPRLHRADLAVLADSGTIAIEVELTPKAPRRLEGIIRAWRMAIATGTVAEVHYLCEPGQTRRAVERAVANAQAQGLIAISKVAPR